MIFNLAKIDDLNISEKTIFKAIYQYKSISRNDLVKYSNQTPSRVYRLLNSLVDQDLVIETKEKHNSSGRPFISYTINPDSFYILGAYITWDFFSIGLCTFDGKILDATEPIRFQQETPQDVVTYFKREIERFLEVHEIPTEKVLGLGISVPGPINQDKGIMWNEYHKINEHWNIIPIRDLLEIEIGIPITIDNLVNAALFGEVQRGSISLNSNTSAAYILFDRGVGSAFFTPGLLTKGQEFSGQLGHTIVKLDGNRCVCGKNGCLETYISINSLISRMKNRLVNLKGEDKMAVSTQLQQIEMMVEDNVNSLDFQEIVQSVVIALGNFIHLFQPETVIYGGRIVDFCPSLIMESIDQIKQKMDISKNIQFRKSSFDNNLLISGSAITVLEENFHVSIPFPYK